MPATRSGPTLLVAIPCLDEERTVGDVVRGVPGTLPGIERIRVVVIDDGSSDQTGARALEAGAEVVRHATTRGLGASFQEAVGLALARDADFLVNIDGDGQFDPADMQELLAPVAAGRAQMVTASRFIDPALVPQMPAIKRWGNGWVARIVWLLSGRRFHDVSCGFRCFSREALLRMNLFGSFTYTQESFLDLVFKNLEVVEVPIRVRGVREHGRSRVASSIPRYALRSLAIMLRAFIAYRPFTLFAGLSLLFFAVGGALLAFLGAHYLGSGRFSPHIWSGFVGGAFCFLGVSTLITGLLGDMLVRIRLNQEYLLYLLRRSGP